MVTNPGASQSVLQEMTETGYVDGPGLGRRSVMMMVVMMRAVHQAALDLPSVRLPLAVQRLFPAACSGGSSIIIIKRPVTKKKIGTKVVVVVVVVVLVLEGSGGSSASADYVGGGCAGQGGSAGIKCWLVIIVVGS